MLKKIIEILDDRTVSSLLFSIAGMVIIMSFAYFNQARQNHKPDRTV
jgi:hypothetical protein